MESRDKSGGADGGQSRDHAITVLAPFLEYVGASASRLGLRPPPPFKSVRRIPTPKMMRNNSRPGTAFVTRNSRLLQLAAREVDGTGLDDQRRRDSDSGDARCGMAVATRQAVRLYTRQKVRRLPLLPG
ncbi:hypothetical protein PsYK624_148930 [Phanerochaete sordida]|uniref:Uncharacterized protein n=1 Tax=Phanerochaete sordida TaxID=48140 RepID=A0A9P3GMS0_9APHY|nr:hypothetical protein PsYK624_148930 [Phanerochaete sordida]